MTIAARQLNGSHREVSEGLVRNGTFTLTKRTDIPMRNRIFGSRFIDLLKRAKYGLRRKSQLLAQPYDQEESTYIAIKDLTMHRFSERILLSVAVSRSRIHAFTHDITQACMK